MLLRLVWRAVLVGAIALLTWGSTQAFDAVSYKAVIEKEKVQLGEKVQYMVLVNYGMGTMAPAVQTPSFIQFNVLGDFQNTQEAGEGTDRYMTLKKVWLLEPTETGHLSIATAIITYQDPTTNLLKNGRTEIVFVDVTEGPDHPAATPVPGNAPGAAGNGLPPWVLPWGGGTLALIVVIVLIMALGGKRSAGRSGRALEAEGLQRLERAIGHAESGHLDTYYAALGSALSEYLKAKFDLDHGTLATPALLERLAGFGLPSDLVQRLEQYFQIADRAKFGGFVPDEDQMIVLHGTVKAFFEAGKRLKVKRPKALKPKIDD